MSDNPLTKIIHTFRFHFTFSSLSKLPQSSLLNMSLLPKLNAFVLTRVTRGTKKKVLNAHGVSNLKPMGFVG